MLHTHFSNCYEVLAAQLLGRLQTPASLADVFVPRQVVVPSLAMRRALTLDIARTEGVCAQVEFSFLAPWLWSRLASPGPWPSPPAAPGSRQSPPVTAGSRQSLPATAGSRQSPYAAATLAWRVYGVFCDPAFVAAQPRLARWLAGGDALMAFELARRSAELLEHYSTYRSDGLAAWSAGRAWPGTAAHADAPWQAALWRRLSPALADPAAHALPPARVQGLPEAPATHADVHKALAAPAHIFCLPATPPLHLQWLQALARHADLHIYVLNPCRSHWFDFVDERRLATLKVRGQAQGFEVGNRLLATWGRQTQAQLQALVEASGPGVLDDAVYLPAPGHSLLAEVQNAILDAREPDEAALARAGADGSIEVHVCHALTRQLEVLHGHLLARFARAEAEGRTLLPGRVLVVLPDLEAAAPQIDAVFGTVPRERAIPYTLSGRRRSQRDAPARALLALLALAGSRWAASEVFAVLQQPLVARRFGLQQGADDQPLQQVHAWLLAAGVRWGRDAEHRASLGLPASGTQTWADALARLFLGFALPDDSHTPWCGVLPAGGAEGSAAQALGGLWAFVQALTGLQATVATPQSPAAWAALLQRTLPQFLQPDAGDDAEDLALQAVQAAITGLADDWAAADLHQRLPLAVVRSALERALDAAAPGAVPGGAVTFAAMASLRGLPYEHICVLDMNDGAWPGRSQALEFDLMAAAPRPGDRQRRLDERNVFLDLLLAARRGFFVAYTGRSLRDNSVLTPSVLVAELLDTLGPVAAAVCVNHPLQAFDPEVFDPASDPRLRSFDAELAQAVLASQRAAGDRSGGASGERSSVDADSLAGRQQDGSAEVGETAFDDAKDASGDADPDADESDTAAQSRPAFFNGPLPAPPAGVEPISLAQLVRFFRQPSRSLLQQRLGIRLPEDEETLSDDEAFVPDRAARRALAAHLLPALLAGQPPADALTDALALAQAGTAWPAGDIGAATLAAELPALQAFAGRVRAAQTGPLRPALDVRLDGVGDGAAWQLTAILTGPSDGGLLRWRHAAATGADMIDAWLHHLLLCLGLQQSGRSDVAARTTHLAADRDWVFKPVADPAAVLQHLLALWVRGQRAPLHFYPRTAWVQAQFAARRRAKKRAEALSNAAAISNASAAAVAHATTVPGAPAAAGEGSALRPGRTGASVQASFSAVRGAWQSRPGGVWAEGDDAHYRLALRGVAEPLDGEFEALADAVFAPLIEHLQAQDGDADAA